MAHGELIELEAIVPALRVSLKMVGIRSTNLKSNQVTNK